jgi:thiol:disulfide interchange protein DsbC
MLKRALLLFIPLLTLACTAPADEKDIRGSIIKRFPDAQIHSITATPYSGLYEVVADGQVFYTDAKGKYLFLGNIIDLATRENITQGKLQKLMEVDFKSLPLDKAIKVVKGNGERKLAVFSDPDCPFCRRLEHELVGVDNVTIYTLLYPIVQLHPNSVDIARRIWCADDRVKAWNDYMMRGQPPQGDGKCDDPVDDIIALGEKLNVSGTPTLILENNQRVGGYVPARELERLLNLANGK